MKIEELRVLLDGADLLEQWVFDKLPQFPTQGTEVIIPEEINTLMEAFYRTAIKESDSPLLTALEVAIETLAPSYSQFGNMLEVRYNDALKQITLRQ